MFSGIIEGTGRVLQLKKTKKGTQLAIRSLFSLSEIKRGGSLAVNGCCLTVIKRTGSLFEADLSEETLRVTNLGSLRPNDLVNLERPLRLSDRLDGHLVQGHVDGVGKIIDRRETGETLELEIEYPKLFRPYFIVKGSVAVDGISMTVNRLTDRTFTLVVIPHTLKETNLRTKGVGSLVNLEVDVIGKYVESLLKKR